MKALNLTTLVLVILGGINWLMVGLFQFNIISSIFGPDTLITNLIYILVGVSAVYQLVPFTRAIDVGEIKAEASR